MAFVGVFVSSARFVSVHDGAQASDKDCKAEEIVFQCFFTIFFCLSNTEQSPRLPPTLSLPIHTQPTLTVFQDAFSLLLLGIGLPKFV